MPEHAEVTDRSIAELVARLGRVAYGDGYVEGLTPAQWMALRYFTRANRFSRTVSAFAEFHATTRGTASQTVKSLVEQHYLLRTRSPRDGRRVRLDPTERARAVLAGDPLDAVALAARSLSPGAQRTLRRALQRMLGHVARQRGRCLFGTCRRCGHMRAGGSSAEDGVPTECGLFGEPLVAAELDQLCINFEPAGTME